MSIKLFLTLASLSILAQAGCSAANPIYSNAKGASGGGSTSSTQSAELRNAQTKVPSATPSVKADLVLGPEMNGQKFTVFTGQTIFVSLPIDFQKSKVEFAESVMTVIPPKIQSASQARQAGFSGQHNLVPWSCGS